MDAETNADVNPNSEMFLGPAHKEAWNEWLRLSNLLNLRLQEATVITWSQLGAPQTAAGPGSPGTASQTATATYAEPWGSLLQQAMGDAATAFLQELAGIEVPPPVVGGEAGDGIVVEIAWPDLKVVVDLDLPGDDRDELSGLGWIVVAPNIAAVQQALDPAGAR